MADVQRSLLHHVRWFVHALRLRLVGWLLPPGYALWSWGGADGYDEYDQPLIAKEPRRGE